MSKTLTPSGVSGTGSDSLILAMGKNTTRAQKTYKFAITGDSGNVPGANQLTVTQAFTPLANSYYSSATTNMVESSSAQTVTFTGDANGRYLKCVSNSQYITITSCMEYSISAGHAVGNTFTAVSNFEGGSSSYRYVITASLVANAPTTSSGYTITVTTADATTDAGIAQNYTVKVSESGSGGATAVQSVTIDQVPLTLGIGNANRKTLTYSVLPVEADIASEEWSSGNTSVVAIGTYTGIATGVAEGSTLISVTVTDTQGNTATGTCLTTVYDDGSISAQDLTGTNSVKSVATSAASNLTLNNIDLTKPITASESVGWITGAEVSITGGSAQVILTLNSNSGSERSATVTVSAKDLLGKTKTCTFTVTQNAYQSSDVPCTSMTIGGDSTLNNSGNTNTYTVGYLPDRTTQTSCSWSIVSGSSYAEFESTGASAVLKAKSGASANTVVIRATNSYNSSVYAEKTITVTYVAPQAYLSIEDAAGNDFSSVRVHATDTSHEHPYSPRVIATNIQDGSLNIPSKAMGGFSGFIDSAELVTSNGVTFVDVEFTVNTGAERSGSVVVHALDGNSDDVSATIGYTQAAATVNPNTITITSFTVDNTTQAGRVNVEATVSYYNGSAYSTTFPTPSFTIKGYDSSDVEQTEKTGSFSDVEVASYATRSVSYSFPGVNAFRWIGTLDDHYTMVVHSGTVTSDTATFEPEE